MLGDIKRRSELCKALHFGGGDITSALLPQHCSTAFNLRELFQECHSLATDNIKGQIIKQSWQRSNPNGMWFNTRPEDHRDCQIRARLEDQMVSFIMKGLTSDFDNERRLIVGSLWRASTFFHVEAPLSDLTINPKPLTAILKMTTNSNMTTLKGVGMKEENLRSEIN